MSDIKFDGQFDEYVSFQADFGVVTSTAAVVDPTVTEDSPNPVASSGIYTFVKDEVSAEKTSRDAAIFAESQERMKGDEDIQRYVTSKIEAEESARSSADTDLANSISELSRNTVRTINHISPDPDGNVNVEGGSGLVDDVKVNGASVVTDKVANVAVPTKVSSLENDAGYITESDIPTIPTKTSQLTNDSGFITSADVPAPYDDTEIREEISGLDDKIKDLELFKFPNVTIIGTPTINNGQISDFSATSYLKFPFLVDFRSQPFEINMAFTTGANVVNQENIFDSDYGLAFAIRNSRFVIAISTNGTSWDLGEGVGTLTVQPNTTYYIKIAWNGSQYILYYSFDGVSYIPDITKAGTAQPYPKQIYIGVGENFASVVNHFGGTINLNNANLKVNGEVFWSGMDDAGISTRADVSLSNIDADGEAKIKEVAETDSIKASLNNKIEDSALTPLRDNISTLTSQMASKQNKLTAGTNIIIENDVISASGTVSAVDDVARAGVTEVKDTLTKLDDRVDVLEKMSKGILYDFVTQTVEGNQSIPKGSHLADIQKLLGKTVVADNTLKSVNNTKVTVGTVDYPLVFNGKSAGTIRDEIDFINKEYIQRVGSVDLGDMRWSDNGAYETGREYVCIINGKANGITNMICGEFTTSAVRGFDVIRGRSANSSISICSTDTNLSSFVKSLKGTILFYELAEPIVTNITDIDSITVEPNGSMVFDTEIPLTSTVEYLRYLNEV